MTEQQQNKQNNTSEITFKQIPFNMTVAKRISDGSVRGRVKMLSKGGIELGRATFTYANPYGDVFTIVPSEVDIEHTSPYVICFNNEGKSIGNHDRNGYQLAIEIPVEDPGDNSQEKDSHYHKCKIEPIEYILANDLGFCEGNVVKYITRYKDKGHPLDDLRKIIVYVNYLIQDLTDK